MPPKKAWEAFAKDWLCHVIKAVGSRLHFLLVWLIGLLVVWVFGYLLAGHQLMQQYNCHG